MANLQSVETRSVPLYEQLAQDIARQIENGAFPPGERLPSVRQVSRERSLSVTTILQAYRLLEDRGAVEARPQSGYFVRPRAPEQSVSEPDPALRSLPCDIDVSDLLMQIQRAALDPTLIQFAAANAAPDLLPTARLNRILANLTRRTDLPHNICSIPDGIEELRVQVARHAFASGCSLSPGELVITSGCMEAVSLALRAVCKAGDLVAVESPTYFGMLQALEVLDLKALEIPTHSQTGISLEALEFALEHHPIRAVLVMPNFSNPLGCLMPEENKRRLVEMLSARGIPLIEDDIFGELYFGAQRPKVCKAYDTDGNVLLCSSFSKDISPSYRVGWIAPGRYLNQIKRIKMATSLGSALLPQLAIAQFLTSGGYEHHLRKIRRAYAQKVSGMAQAVLRHFPAGTRVTSPAGGFVLWVQMPEQVDSVELYGQSLKAGITLVPGILCSAAPRYRNFVRLNAAYWSPESEAAVTRLGAMVERLANH